MGKFVIKEVPTGVQFELKAVNGETVASSRVYPSEDACAMGIRNVQISAPEADIEDQTRSDYGVFPLPKFELWKDVSGSFSFQLKSKTGEVIATSQTYTTKASCMHGIESVQLNVRSAVIIKESPQ